MSGTLTLTSSNLPGVWLDPDVKRMVGVGKRNPRLNISSDSYMFRKRISSTRSEIPQLKKQYGCFALDFIDVGVCLGVYTGIIYTPRNYESCKKSHKTDYVIKTHDCKHQTYYIEPYDDKMLLQWINDGNHNSPVDLNNVEFVECEIDHIPLIKVVSIKRIRKNQQIFVDYGKAYWKAR